MVPLVQLSVDGLKKLVQGRLKDEGVEQAVIPCLTRKTRSATAMSSSSSAIVRTPQLGKIDGQIEQKNRFVQGTAFEVSLPP